MPRSPRTAAQVRALAAPDATGCSLRLLVLCLLSAKPPHDRWKQPRQLAAHRWIRAGHTGICPDSRCLSGSKSKAAPRMGHLSGPHIIWPLCLSRLHHLHHEASPDWRLPHQDDPKLSRESLPECRLGPWIAPCTEIAHGGAFLSLLRDALPQDEEAPFDHREPADRRRRLIVPTARP